MNTKLTPNTKKTLFLLLFTQFTFFLLQGQRVNPIWSFTDFGDNPASIGLESVDLDGDGQNEIIIGSLNDIKVLKKTNSPYQFNEYLFNCFDGTIADFTFFDEDNDGDMEIFVIEKGSEIYKLDVENGEPNELFLGKIGLLAKALAVDDINQDGITDFIVAPELTVSFSGNLAIYNLRNDGFFLLKDFPAVDISDFKLADVNNDGYKDIVQATGLNNSIIVDGKNFNILHNTTSIRGLVDVADIDSDTIVELITIGGSNINIYDVQTLELINTFSVIEGSIRSFYIGDITLDNGLEILIGSGGSPPNKGGIYIYNLNSGNLIWEKSDFSFFTTTFENINYFDIDGDETEEIVFGTTNFNSAGSLVSLEALGLGNLEYKSNDFSGNPSHQLVEINDKRNLFLLTNELQHLESNIILRQFDFDTFTLVDETTLTTAEFGFIQDVFVTQTRGKNQLELVISAVKSVTENDFNGRVYTIYIYDFESRELIKSFSDREVTSSINHAYLILDDIDNDELSELILFSSINNGTIITFDFRNENYVEDSKTSSLFTQYPGDIPIIKTLQVDSDESPEFLVSNANKLIVFDFPSLSVQSRLDRPFGSIGDFIISDYDKDGIPNFFSFGDYRIREFDLSSFELIREQEYNLTFSRSRITSGAFLQKEKEHILIFNGTKFIFINPENLSIEQQYKSNSSGFAPYQISNFRNCEKGIDGLVLGNNTGINVYDFCDSLNEQITVSVLTVADDKVGNELVLYPNPVKDRINLKFQKLTEKEATINIYNNLGQRMQTLPKIQFSNDVLSIDLNDFENGIYLLSVEIKGFPIITKKFVR